MREPRCASLDMGERLAQTLWHHGLMALFARAKEKERFYLLPGMGGSNLRRKRKLILKWTIAAGILTSAVLGCILYWIGTR